MIQLSDHAGKYAGADIYVIGSGKTMDYYPDGFFNNKITVAINDSWIYKLDQVDYLVTKYHSCALDYADDPRIRQAVVCTKGDRGDESLGVLTDQRILIVEHNRNTVVNWSGEFPSHGLVATYSSIITGMHLAAILGAASIIMVGADCGLLDEATNMEGHSGSVEQSQFFPHFDKQNTIAANYLRQTYGCSVVSLLPFVTPNMEGHCFTSHAGRLN